MTTDDYGGAADINGIAVQPFSFRSQGELCAGDLRLPAWPGPHAVVILAAGLGGTRLMRLPAFADRFARAGVAAVTFDYRHFGDSEGTPRQLIDIAAQRHDWTAAIDAVRARSDIDTNKVALWGTSFAGGHVLSVAAARRDVQAVVAQGPFTDGWASARTLGAKSMVKLTGYAAADVVNGVRGRGPAYVQAFGPRGSAALMTAPDAMPGVQRLVESSPVAVDTRVAARIALHIGLDRPGRALSPLSAPTLIQVCRGDSVAPDTATLRHIRRANNPLITAEVLPYGHFDIYFGDAFDRITTRQIEFLHQAGL